VISVNSNYAISAVFPKVAREYVYVREPSFPFLLLLLDVPRSNLHLVGSSVHVVGTRSGTPSVLYDGVLKACGLSPHDPWECDRVSNAVVSPAVVSPASVPSAPAVPPSVGSVSVSVKPQQVWESTDKKRQIRVVSVTGTGLDAVVTPTVLVSSRKSRSTPMTVRSLISGYNPL
jgi:hypothetical protein